MMSAKPVLFSGIQPSGHLTIGNYIGAIKNWCELQESHECYFSIADLHAITVKQDPKILRSHSFDISALLIACGIDPDKSILFLQSHVPQHTELAWILNCHTYLGELNRMTQFKDKSKQNNKNINAGLFNYPSLQAADVLLYDTNLVPVGSDQKQHLELCRDLAIRMNNTYGDIFTVPEPYIPKVGARVMSLQDPLKKMSKSDTSEANYIALLDEPDKIMKKCKRAVTDSDTDIRYDIKEKPALSNLLSLYAVLDGTDIKSVEGAFNGQGYGQFKEALGEKILEVLTPIQEAFKSLREDEDSLKKILRENADKAKEKARAKIKTVNDAIGFIVP